MRTSLTRFALGMVVVLAGTIAPSPAVAVQGPPTVTPEDIRFMHRHTKLRYGSPHQVGLIPAQIDRMVPSLESYLVPTPDHPDYPTYGGAVVLAAKDGVIVEHEAIGHAAKYERYDIIRDATGRIIEYRGVELPPEQQVPMRKDTIFDLASISKLFTAVATMQLVEAGRLDLDAPVVDYLPEFGAVEEKKRQIVLRQLLTHTSGMVSWTNLYVLPDDAARMSKIYSTPLRRDPGIGYEYSDLNLITLGKIIEKVTGKTLDRVVHDQITRPLGMTETGYRPDSALKHRTAATEYQSNSLINRGLVWGEVHDENAWSFNGVAGHAGVFSTARDLSIFAQMLLNGGRYGGARILDEDSVREALVNYNEGLGAGARRGIGFELYKHFYMGPLATPVTFGHTGFTGTSLVIDPLSHSFLILLTNRVHPAREWGGNNPARQAVARDFGLATPVRPAVGRTAWFSGHQDRAALTLTGDLRQPAELARMKFRLWYDTEPGFDYGQLESSADGGVSWASVPFELRAGRHNWSSDGRFEGFGGRQWLSADAPLPTGTTHVRWVYQSDGSAGGRGVYVDGVLVLDGRDVLLSSERPADANRFHSNGWVQTAH